MKMNKPEIIWHKEKGLIEIHTDTGSVSFHHMFASDVSIELAQIEQDAAWTAWEEEDDRQRAS